MIWYLALMGSNIDSLGPWRLKVVVQDWKSSSVTKYEWSKITSAPSLRSPWIHIEKWVSSPVAIKDWSISYLESTGKVKWIEIFNLSKPKVMLITAENCSVFSIMTIRSLNYVALRVVKIQFEKKLRKEFQNSEIKM